MKQEEFNFAVLLSFLFDGLVHSCPHCLVEFPTNLSSLTQMTMNPASLSASCAIKSQFGARFKCPQNIKWSSAVRSLRIKWE